MIENNDAAVRAVVDRRLMEDVDRYELRYRLSEGYVAASLDGVDLFRLGAWGVQAGDTIHLNWLKRNWKIPVEP